MAAASGRRQAPKAELATRGLAMLADAFGERLTRLSAADQAELMRLLEALS